jgi:hypothetical protein
MYGKERVVLSSAPTRSGKSQIGVAGKRGPGRGGNYFPIGVWWEQDGEFYADLKTAAQWYATVSSHELGKSIGGFPTKTALRDCVMAYYLKNGETK